MSDLIGFLAERLDEDERIAAAATGTYRWRPGGDPGQVWADRDAAGWDANLIATVATRLNPDPDLEALSNAAHIAHYDPARALRDVVARREVLVSIGKGWSEASWAADGVLRAFAAPYADHPDFDPDWSVTE